MLLEGDWYSKSIQEKKYTKEQRLREIRNNIGEIERDILRYNQTIENAKKDLAGYQKTLDGLLDVHASLTEERDRLIHHKEKEK